MASTNFLQFDSQQQNMLNDTDYNSDAQRVSGVSEGIARSSLYNKTLFQLSTMAKAFADTMVENGQNAMDNNLVSLKQAIKSCFATTGANNVWTGNNIFKSIYENSSDLVKGTTPSSSKYLGLYFCDKNGTNHAANQIGQLQFTYATDGVVSVKMNCLKPLANSTESASFGVGYQTDGTTQYASASAGVKKSIVEWAMPNYGSGVSKSASTNYTETSNGFLYVSVQRAGSSQGIMSLKIGSKTFEIKSNDYSWDSLMFPIARGVTYSYTLSNISNYTVTFYPCYGG